MNLFRILVLVPVLPFLAQAEISNAEYFFNSDDLGPGSNTAMSVTVSDGVASLSESIDLTSSGLTSGLHVTFIRFEDDGMGWGPVRGIPFLIMDPAETAEITDAEYFFDSDDAGPGNNTSLDIGTAGESINLSDEVNVGGLAPGLHSISLRLYSSEFNGYGPVRSALFVVTEAASANFIQSAQYYIGSTDNLVTVTSPADGTFDELMEAIAATEVEIPDGLLGSQAVGVRFQHSNGNWGPWATTELLIRETAEALTVQAAEYFIDVDPGIGLGTAIAAPVDGAFDEAEEEFDLPVDLEALEEGRHVAYLRLQNSAGQWGAARGSIFYVSEDAQPVIAAAEYFTNPSTPEGAGTPFDPLDGAFNSLEEEVSTTVSIASLGLDVGTHAIYARFQNSQGLWGPVSSRNFSVETRPQITVSVDTLDFGTLFTGDSRTLGFTIGNIGDESLEVSALNFTDNAYSANWSGGTIVPLAEVTVEVTFAPEDPAASHPATLSIANNDATQSIVLSGVGLETAPIMSVVPDSLDFGTVQTIASAGLSVRISNSGNENLVLSTPTFTDAAFSAAIPNPTVEPDSYVDIEINFAPSIAGVYTDSVFINSNDTYFPVFPIYVTGVGSAVPVPNIQVSESVLEFGNIALDDPPVQRSLTIQNTGTLSLNITSLDSDEPAFTSSVTGAQTINPGGVLPVTMTFTPVDSRVYAGRFTIVNDDPDSPNVEVQLSGSSVFPDMVLSTNTFNFGEVGVTTSSTQSLIITNIGTDTLKITGFTNSSDIDTVVSVSPASFNVAPGGGQRAFSVEFSPSEPLEYSGIIVIASNADADTLYISGTGLDDEAPEITFDPTLIENTGTQENSPVTIIAPVADNNQLAWVRLYYRQGGKAVYDSLDMSSGPDGFSGTIPAAYVVNRGVEYYIAAFDGANLQTIPETAPAVPAVVRVRVPSLPAFTFTAQEYGMFSVPTDLDQKGIQTILESNLGEYDVNKWRLFRWVNGNYVELTERPNFAFDPGKAYWLITKDRQVINMDSSTSVQTNEDYLLSLDQGWNQVATPFYFPVAWSDVYANSPNVVQGLVAYEWVDDDWAEAVLLEPFKGYFIYTPSTNILRFPPREVTPTLLKATREQMLEEGEWTVHIQAHSQGYSDRANFAGVLNSADAGYDLRDRREAPRPGGASVNLYFDHSRDWSTQSGRYSGDFQAANEEGHYWDLTLEQRNLDGAIDLALSVSNGLPEGFELLLINRDLRYILGSSTTGQLEVQQVDYPGIDKQTLRLLVGTAEYLARNTEGIGIAPEHFALEPNYPNPFNGSTRIQYQIPEPAPMRLTIVDIRGREIVELQWSQLHPVGNYAISWDGNDTNGHRVASGVYLLVLQSSEHLLTRKMVLLK